MGSTSKTPPTTSSHRLRLHKLTTCQFKLSRSKRNKKLLHKQTNSLSLFFSVVLCVFLCVCRRCPVFACYFFCRVVVIALFFLTFLYSFSINPGLLCANSLPPSSPP